MFLSTLSPLWGSWSPPWGSWEGGTQVYPWYLIQDPAHPIKQHLEEMSLVKSHSGVTGVQGPGG